MQKNETLTLTAIDYTEQAHAVCKLEGFVVFVPGMMIHEVAEVLILKVNKNLAYGKVTRLLKANPDRQMPLCPIADKCGGCQLQHMTYDHQLEFKSNHVKSLFKRTLNYEGPFDPIEGMDNPWYYRNKAQVPFDATADINYGFYRAHSHDLLPMEKCYIQDEDSNAILKEIKAFYIKHDTTTDLIRTVLIKKGFETQELMVILVVRSEDLPLKDELVKYLQIKFTNLKAILLNINAREDNVILSDEYVSLTKTTTIKDSLGHLTFQVSAPSFYQVNPTQAEVLYAKALEYANLKGTETLLDLYCGVGTIALFASLKVKQVIGVEVVQAAIEDAKINASLNRIKNVEWLCADAGQAVEQLLERKLNPDVVIVDPPRKGLDETTRQAILKLLPQKLVYVSCDPGTLVRDLKQLTYAYNIEKVACVDMFPQTFHVETVVLMSRV